MYPWERERLARDETRCIDAGGKERERERERESGSGKEIKREREREEEGTRDGIASGIDKKKSVKIRILFSSTWCADTHTQSTTREQERRDGQIDRQTRGTRFSRPSTAEQLGSTLPPSVHQPSPPREAAGKRVREREKAESKLRYIISATRDARDYARGVSEGGKEGRRKGGREDACHRRQRKATETRGKA